MKENKMLEYAKDMKSDLTFALQQDEDYIPKKKDLEVIQWLVEEAKRAEMYKSALIYIGSKQESPSSSYANMALYEADQRFNKS